MTLVFVDFGVDLWIDWHVGRVHVAAIRKPGRIPLTTLFVHKISACILEADAATGLVPERRHAGTAVVLVLEFLHRHVFGIVLLTLGGHHFVDIVTRKFVHLLEHVQPRILALQDLVIFWKVVHWSPAAAKFFQVLACHFLGIIMVHVQVMRAANAIDTLGQRYLVHLGERPDSRVGAGWRSALSSLMSRSC